MIEIFIAQFLAIYLLGFQQMNVIGKHYILAFITSLLLGVFGYYITSTVSTANLDQMFTPFWWSFIIAGPCGIITAMYTHPWIKKKFYRED